MRLPVQAQSRGITHTITSVRQLERHEKDLKLWAQYGRKQLFNFDPGLDFDTKWQHLQFFKIIYTFE